jgi:hypothetical protein
MYGLDPCIWAAVEGWPGQARPGRWGGATALPISPPALPQIAAGVTTASTRSWRSAREAHRVAQRVRQREDLRRARLPHHRREGHEAGVGEAVVEQAEAVSAAPRPAEGEARRLTADSLVSLPFRSSRAL